ncbi:MAG: amidohydrolase family protein [Desulfobacula sp.]|jgi:hypothetical protein|nr:amidohydrolase family protein [Desulfobacula sp.]MBT6341308.1 amidohydrolase family protein [Desulfobacula sp.]MBT7260811.1 amidohydrolase family protein [Desulfobacula sp.]
MKTRQFILFVIILFVLFSCSKVTNNLKVPSQKINNVVIIQNINLVDMTSDKIIKGHSVFIKGDKIIEIKPTESIKIPENSKMINGEGGYLMPGLSDMHIHTNKDWNNWPVSPLRLYLANGVTTIRCLGPKGGDQKYALRWREKISKGQLIGPTIYASGPIIYGPVQDPERTVNKNIDAGFDFIKLYSFLSQNEFQKIMTMAKQKGVYTVGHIPFQVGLDGVVSNGIDEIAHIEELAWEFVHFNKQLKIKGYKWIPYVIKMAFQQYQAAYSNLSIVDLEKKLARSLSSVADKVKTADLPVDTTLYIDDVIVEKLFEPNTFISKPINKYLPGSYINRFKQKKEKHQIQFKGGEDFAIFKRNLDRLIFNYLKRQKVFLVLGTDSGTGAMGIVPGYSIHEELRILTESGYSPFEAIKTGTVNAAMIVDKMNGKGNFGTIEKGKRADLILIKNNPLENVSNIKNIVGVMASGRWYDKAMLKKLIEL